MLVKIGASEKGKGHSSVNLEYHELAHSIDYKILKYGSKTEGYKAIWNEEKVDYFQLDNIFYNMRKNISPKHLLCFMLVERKRKNFLSMLQKHIIISLLFNSLINKKRVFKK